MNEADIYKSALYMAVNFAVCPMENCPDKEDCLECKVRYWVEAARQIHGAKEAKADAPSAGE